MIGRVINDRFKIVSLIARGGMGKVYRAEQASLGRVCALKVLNPTRTGEADPEFSKRFFLEASIASRLTHPNTVTIFDYGCTPDDVYFIAMEHLEGRTLHRVLRDDGPLPEQRAVHVTRQVCRALREAHALGVIHRDLKPANIFLIDHPDEPDFVKVLDFGLVKRVEGNVEELTQSGLFMGSPKYMSPEQVRGERVDVRTDVYSLGVLLYEMVTGKVPFDRPSSVNILMAHVKEAPPPLAQANAQVKVSTEFERIIFTCLAKNPADRFASLDELLLALKQAGSGAASGGFSVPPTAPGVVAASSPAPPQATTDAGSMAPDAEGAAQAEGSSGVGPASTSQSGPLPTLASERHGEGGAPRKGGGAALVGFGVAAAAVLVLVIGSGKFTSGATRGDAGRVGAESIDKARGEAVLHIETDPPGAAVKLHDREGAEICAATPCAPTVSARRGAEVTLWVSKAGHVPESRRVTVGDERVSIKLQPVQVGSEGAGGAGGAAGGGQDDAGGR